jgi:enoyl-CoA hydratase/carnithine racemase
VLTLDRPQARNAVDPANAAALRDAFKDSEKDDEARMLVLTGTGSHFCAGADIEAVSGLWLKASVAPRAVVEFQHKTGSALRPTHRCGHRSGPRAVRCTVSKRT